MKTSRIVVAASAVLLLAISPAFANPDMLPKHPGYPMGNAMDPVKGQSLANDPGQTNATGAGSLARSITIISGFWRSPAPGCCPEYRGPTSRLNHR